MEDVTVYAVAVTTTQMSTQRHASFYQAAPNATSRCQRTHVCVRSLALSLLAVASRDGAECYTTTTQLRRVTVISVLFVTTSSYTVAAPSRAKLFPLCES